MPSVIDFDFVDRLVQQKIYFLPKYYLFVLDHFKSQLLWEKRRNSRLIIIRNLC